MSGVSDTPPEVERLLVDGYRRMSPAQKLQRVVGTNRALEQLAPARLRARYGEMDERTLRLRLASLRLDPQLMADVFGWDPRVHGL